MFRGIICGLVIVLVLILLTVYICYRLTFHVIREKEEEFPVPRGKVYEPYRQDMIKWMKQVREMPCRELSVQSFDGLTLRGRYYEYAPDAPVELMFHGYRGTSERDLCGAVQRCAKLGHSALLVDQRGCGRSEGKVITFGVKESRDCRVWIDHVISTFGPEVQIILGGISMGASTVLMVAGEQDLPANVIGVLADCGFSSARGIIRDVMKKLKLPAGAVYPVIKLGARIFAGFDLEERPPAEMLRRCQVPVIFIHGEADDFVPCEMSRENYRACSARKALFTVPGAGHGLSYLVDPPGYLKAMGDFFGHEVRE